MISGKGCVMLKSLGEPETRISISGARFFVYNFVKEKDFGNVLTMPGKI